MEKRFRISGDRVLKAGFWVGLISVFASQGWARMVTPKKSVFAPAKVSEPSKVRARGATMGVRGLEEGTLQQATPNRAEAAKLGSFAVEPTELEAFGARLPRAIEKVRAAGAAHPSDEQLEIQAGEELAASLLGAAPLVDDPPLQGYVNRVGHWVSDRSERPDLPWKFGVIASDSINAFAAPGGKILVTAGLFQLLRSEAELAAVLAHEIAHVTARHHFQFYLQQLAMEKSLSGLKGVALPPPMRMAMERQLKRGALFFSAALDRNAERDADRLAALLVVDAGYSAVGLKRVLERLEKVREEGGQEKSARFALLLQTHPLPHERIQALEGVWLGRLPASQDERRLLADRFAEFSLEKTRFRALSR